ncbi:MAG: sulfite reductase, partial [Candidatus Levybacteria bacterium]|nr:sulfite reductase [Candidatus Levybacteria bacterium]
MSENQTYSRLNPFVASVKERHRLSKSGSGKNTQHVTLDISGSGIVYQPGDSLGIYPTNDPHLVEWTIFAMRAKGDELIADKQGELHSLRTYLQKKANITEISRKVLQEVCGRQTNIEKKEALEHLLSEGQKEALKAYLAVHEVWDFLEENIEVHFSPEELCHLMMPLLPRLYSISSAQKVVGDEIHLTVAMLEYETNQTQRKGVCTHYICNLAPLNEKSV